MFACVLCCAIAADLPDLMVLSSPAGNVSDADDGAGTVADPARSRWTNRYVRACACVCACMGEVVG